MNGKVKNCAELLRHGDISSREIVITLTDKVLQKLDAYQQIKSIMRLDGSILHIGRQKWDLSLKKNVYLLGAGKACNAMAMAVEEVLGDRLTDGVVIVKISEPTDHFKRSRVFVGGHPLPNEEGLRACHEILQLVDHASADDLFIVVISGGSSALMSCPVDGLSLQDEIVTTDVLLKAGIGIQDLNAVRRHISQLNGGMLAKRIEARGAELIGLGISDAVGKPQTEDISIPRPDYHGTPIGPDETTFDDARRVIRITHTEDLLPKPVVDYIKNGSADQETPKAFPQNTYFLINTLPDSCKIAEQVAREMGLNAVTLTTFLEGESREAGMFFASLAREIQTNSRPFSAPCVILAAGETTTKISDNAEIRGHGGPSHELVAAFALAASKVPGACMLSIDTEGTDGTTLYAGGLTDSKTAEAARLAGIDLYEALRGHAVGEALVALNDAVFTGNTGTNLCDLNVLYVPAAASDRFKKS